MLTHVLFQATINLLIGYEPPANATSTLNDPPDADTSQVDAGESQNYFMEDKMLHLNIIFVYFASQEAPMKVMKRRRLWTVETQAEVCPLPLRRISLGNPGESQSDSAERGTEPWPTNLRTSRYCLRPDLISELFLIAFKPVSPAVNYKIPKRQHSCLNVPYMFSEIIGF